MVAVNGFLIVRHRANSTCCSVEACVFSVKVKILCSRTTLHLMVAVCFVNGIVVIRLGNKLKILRIFLFKVIVIITVNHITADCHKVNISFCGNLKSICKVRLTEVPVRIIKLNVNIRESLEAILLSSALELFALGNLKNSRSIFYSCFFITLHSDNLCSTCRNSCVCGHFKILFARIQCNLSNTCVTLKGTCFICPVKNIGTAFA